MSDVTDFFESNHTKERTGLQAWQKGASHDIRDIHHLRAIISSAAAAAGRADLLFDAEGWQIEAMPDLR